MSRPICKWGWSEGGRDTVRLKYAPCLPPNYDQLASLPACRSQIPGALHRCRCHKVEVSNFLCRSHEMFKCPMGNCLSPSSDQKPVGMNVHCTTHGKVTFGFLCAGRPMFRNIPPMWNERCQVSVKYPAVEWLPASGHWSPTVEAIKSE